MQTKMTKIMKNIVRGARGGFVVLAVVGVVTAAVSQDVFAQAGTAPATTAANPLGEVVDADAPAVLVSAFVRDDCKHCSDMKEFLAEVQAGERGDQIDVRYHDMAIPEEHAKFVATAQKFDLPQGTPIILVGTTVFQGFDRGETTGAMMMQLVDASRAAGSAGTTFDAILDGASPEITVGSAIGSTCTGDMSVNCDTSSFSVRVPIVGTEISLATMSLSAISLTLGFIDGFNPCALWVLIVFLTLLMQAGSKKRMFQYAGLFILAEAIMYWLILIVWFSAWDFIGLSRIVTPLVGLLALGSGTYFLYKFVTWKNVCTVMGLEEQNSITAKIRALSGKPMTWITAAGIIALAFSVNVFEFACSIGIPQAFTKILELNALTFWETQFQMLLYILMYMVDDVIVFAIALYGADRMGDAMKYSKWTTLIGGLLMAILGVLMLFNPEALVF